MNRLKTQTELNTADLPMEIGVLESINPAELDYDDWLRVGMALKSAGAPCETWQTWSARDPKRFHDGECERKWNGFNGEGVGSGTILRIAKQQGWKPPRTESTGPRVVYNDWNFMLPAPDKGYEIAKPRHIEVQATVAPPEDWNPPQQIIDYLNTLFSPEEIVGYVLKSSLRPDGRYTPKGSGIYSRTAGEIIEDLRTKQFQEALCGVYDPAAGAWVRINSLDGKGISDANVVTFRHVLVEADDWSIEDQMQLYTALELPIAALVHSGGKSLHAIVKMDATTRQEYDERVDFLFTVLEKNGLEKKARNNRNPSRLSRLPGIERAGQKQYLVGTHLGKESWEVWKKHIEAPGVLFSTTRVAGSGPMPKPIFKNGPIPGGFGLLIGEDGVGKGWAILDLLLSCTLGRPVNLQTISYQGAPLRVLYLCYEDLAPALEWRLDCISGTAGLSPDEWRRAEESGLLTVKALPMRPEDGDAPPLFQQELHGTPQETEFFKRLEQYLVGTKRQLCIIDPLAAAAVLQSENDNASMNAVAVSLRTMAARTGCTVILVHHTSKAAHGSQHHHAARGGSALPGAGRWQMQISQEKHDAPLYLSISKNSYGRRVFDVQLKREDNGVIRELTGTEVATRARELIYKIVAWIKAHPERIINHNAVRNRSGDAKFLVEAMAESMGARPSGVFDAITSAANEGLLQILEIQHNRKTINKVTVPDEALEAAQVAGLSDESDCDEEIPFD